MSKTQTCPTCSATSGAKARFCHNCSEQLVADDDGADLDKDDVRFVKDLREAAAKRKADKDNKGTSLLDDLLG